MSLAVSLELNLILLIVLLFLSGFFSGIETALTSISKMRIKHLINEGNKKAKTLEKLKEKPQKLLITILIGNNLVNIGASSLATVLMLDLFPSEIGIAITTGIMTFLILVFGEITPKTFALKNAEKISLTVAQPILLMQKIFFPIIYVFEKISNSINKIIGTGQETSLTEAELRSIVSLGEQEGAIKSEEKEMIHKIFEFNDIQASEIMTPISEVDAIESKTPMKKIKTIIKNTTHSRIPIYNKTKDNIYGILYLKDILEYWAKGKTFKLNDLIRKPFFVPETKKIDVLLKEMQTTKTQLSMIINEHGGVIGIVSIEDILEELVGEIYDEDDEIPTINEIKPNYFKADPQLPIQIFNEKFKTKFKSEEHETLAGLIQKKLDKIPQKKDKIKINKNLTGKITKMKGPRIKEIIITKKKKQEKK